MADKVKKVEALTVFTPILPDRVGPLQDVLDALPVGEDSPVAAPGRTHFARWVIIPELVFEGPPQKPDTLGSEYLLFTSSFDGPTDTYLDALRTQSKAAVDSIWSNCVGYPGSDDGKAFVEYIRRNHIRTNFFVTAYPHLRVPDVRKSLELRERMIDFAIHTQGLSDAELQKEFLEKFPEDPAGMALEGA